MEKEKLLLNFYLEEYKVLSDQILQRVTHQQTILNYQLVTVGIFLTISLNVFTKPDIFKLLENIFVFYLFSGSSLIFLFFSWAHSNHDLMIISTARYINTDLRRNISLLLGEKVFEFEDFLEKDRKSKIGKFGVLPALGNESNLSILMSIAILIISFIAIIYYIQTNFDIFHFAYQLTVFIINILLISRTIYLKIKISKEYIQIAPPSITGHLG